MNTPPDDSAQSGGTLDETGELLERYLVAMGKDTIDPHVQAFAKTHPKLIHVAEALKTSWRNELTARTEMLPPAGKSRRTVRRIVGTLLGRFADSAMAALFNRKVMTLTVAEMEQLRAVIEQAEPAEK